MKLTSAFLTGVLFGGGFGLIGGSIAWDMRCASHRAEIERLLTKLSEVQEGNTLSERLAGQSRWSTVKTTRRPK